MSDDDFLPVDEMVGDLRAIIEEFDELRDADSYDKIVYACIRLQDECAEKIREDKQ